MGRVKGSGEREEKEYFFSPLPLPLPSFHQFRPRSYPKGFNILLSSIFHCHKIKDGGYKTRFRPPLIRLHRRLENTGSGGTSEKMSCFPCRDVPNEDCVPFHQSDL